MKTTETAGHPGRGAIAGSVHQLGRAAYHRLTAATAARRLMPGFIMIGAQRCGTTSLFLALAEHPQVMRPAFRKGINYFDLNYARGESWYRGHFPITALARRAAAGHGEPVAFEASGYYLYHPLAAERLWRDLPAARLVVMLRDPVERAFSGFKHERACGFEPEESFEKALELEDERIAGETERMRADPGYEGYAHRHHSYRHRGQYAEQLERFFAFFPREQVHVVPSEAYYAQPAREYRRLLAFLGLSPFEPESFTRPKAHPSAPMNPATRQRLERHYAPHNQRLARLLGDAPGWAGDPGPGKPGPEDPGPSDPGPSNPGPGDLAD